MTVHDIVQRGLFFEEFDTDARYLHRPGRTVTEWAAGWARRGWRRKTGPVENLDLVRPLYERSLERPELEIVWIKAHAGNRWNEYADALATAYARDAL